MSKQVDAVIGAYRNVELNQAVEGVAGKCFFVEEEGVPVYDELVYVANSDKLDAAERQRFPLPRRHRKGRAIYRQSPGEELRDLSSYSTELEGRIEPARGKTRLPASRAHQQASIMAAGAAMNPI